MKLHGAFVDAGLSAPEMHGECVAAGGANSADAVHLVADLVGTLVDDIERLGIATRREIDEAILADRIIAQVAEQNSVIVGRREIGAWTRA